jgi:peroxiredoxin
MKHVLWFALAALAAASLFGQEFKLGSPVGNFAVTDLKGNQVPFSSLKGDITVVAFISTKCPVSNAYNERMKALYKDYTPKGVNFVFINANSTEPAAEVAQHAAKNGFPFAVYKDEGNVVADRFGAQVTPEMFVIGKAGTILYHGSIDDSQNPERIHDQAFRAAMDAVLMGRPVAKAETKAFGCSIKRARKAS